MIARVLTSFNIPNGLIKGAGVWNSICSAFAKPLLATVYRFSGFRPSKQEPARNLVEREVIVSMTTYGERLKTLHYCLESVFRQTVIPDRVVLWLAQDEFDESDLPKEVVGYKDQGLEIRFCEDLRSHKKYWGTMRAWPNAVVITVDDDAFYPEDTIEDLLKSYSTWPEAISCHRAHELRFSEGQLSPYTSWNFASPGLTGPSLALVPIGVGGVLYPPAVLAEEVFDTELIKELCLGADDLWLKVHSYRTGTPVVKVRKYSRSLISTPGSQSKSLTTDNVLAGRNDVQIDQVLTHFGVTFVKDVGKT